MADEPIRTITFTLTRADALAWEQANFRTRPLWALALIVWLGACGSAALLVPPDWAGPRFDWPFNILAGAFIAMGYVLVLLVIAVRQWRAAGRRIKRPVDVTLTEWPDRLGALGGGLPRDIGFADITDNRLTRTHLFLAHANDLLIVPRRAFPEEGSIEALADRIAKTPKRAEVDRANVSA